MSGFVKLEVSHLRSNEVDNLLKHERSAGLGIYIMILTDLAQGQTKLIGHLNTTTLHRIAGSSYTTNKVVKRIICDYGLFEIDKEKETFWSPYLMKSMTSKSDTKMTPTRHKQTLTFESAENKGLMITDIDIDKDIDTTTKAAEEDGGSILKKMNQDTEYMKALEELSNLPVFSDKTRALLCIRWFDNYCRTQAHPITSKDSAKQYLSNLLKPERNTWQECKTFIDTRYEKAKAYLENKPCA